MPRSCLVLSLAQDALVTLALRCPTLHTPPSSLDPVTVLGGSQKPDHFVVYMSLDSCAPEPIKNTCKEGEMRGGQRGIVGLTHLLSEGTIRDQPCTADQSLVLPACLPCLFASGEEFGEVS